MNQKNKAVSNVPTMEIEIQGHKVTLCFAEKADPEVVEWFVKKGIHVWSVNEGEQRFESHTDRLTNYIRFWQADGESQKTSIRTKTALSQMVQEGRFRGGYAPYGYRLEKSGILNKRKHEVNKLVIEAKIIRMIMTCVSPPVMAGGEWPTF